MLIIRRLRISLRPDFNAFVATVLAVAAATLAILPILTNAQSPKRNTSSNKRHYYSTITTTTPPPHYANCLPSPSIHQFTHTVHTMTMFYLFVLV